MLLKYFARLSTGRLILWCYLLWYLYFLVRLFDPRPRLWLTSIGLSAIIGIALVISTTSSAQGRTALDRWQIFRLFLMPFCVSSFAALVKDREFILVFSPVPRDNLIAGSCCLGFAAAVGLLKRLNLGAAAKDVPPTRVSA